MRDAVNLLGVYVDKQGFNEAFEKACRFLDGGCPAAIYTPNPEIIMQAHRNPEFIEVLNRGDMVIPDGIGVVYGSKIVGNAVCERVAGYDMTCKLLEYSAKTGKKIYIYGGKEEACALAANKIRERFGAEVCGYTNGYVNDDARVVEDIKLKKPDFVLVCLGACKQESWIDRCKNEIGKGLFIGAGGTVDVLAGRVKRAPDIFIKLNLEWFYRLCKQPSRFVRMLDLPRFILKVFANRKKYEQRMDLND